MATVITSAIRIAGATSPAPDYTTLSLWEDDIPLDLITADEQHIAECYNDWTSGLNDQIQLVSRTTDVTRNIIIDSPTSERHSGIPESGFFLSKSFSCTKNVASPKPDVVVF